MLVALVVFARERFAKHEGNLISHSAVWITLATLSTPDISDIVVPGVRISVISACAWSDIKISTDIGGWGCDNIGYLDIRVRAREYH